MPIYHIWDQNMGKKIGDRKDPRLQGPFMYQIIIQFFCASNEKHTQLIWTTQMESQIDTNVPLDSKYKTNWTLNWKENEQICQSLTLRMKWKLKHSNSTQQRH